MYCASFGWTHVLAKPGQHQAPHEHRSGSDLFHCQSLKSSSAVTQLADDLWISPIHHNFPYDLEAQLPPFRSHFVVSATTFPPFEIANKLSESSRQAPRRSRVEREKIQSMDGALERAVVEQKPVPEMDFTLHAMEVGTQVSTQERVCKGMYQRFKLLYLLRRL